MNHVLEFHADLQKDQIATKNMGEWEKKYKYKNQMTTTTNFYYEKIHMS